MPSGGTSTETHDHHILMSRKALVLLALFALGTAPLIVGAPLWLQALGVWLLGCLVPGYLLTDLLVGASVAPPTPLERGLLTLGSGFALLTIVLLALSYLPGGLVPFLVYGTFAIESVLLGVVTWLALQPRAPRQRSGRDGPHARRRALIRRSQYGYAFSVSAYCS